MPPSAIGLSIPPVGLTTSGNVTVGLQIPVAIAHGGTGATTAPQARINLGITTDELFPEAPTDGASYLRRGSDQSWQAGLLATGGTITGDLTVTGDTNLNRLTVSGPTNLTSTLNVAGNTTLTTLNATGATTLQNLTVNGTLTAAGGVGTVTSITAGTGLTATPNPIVGAGTLAIANDANLPGAPTAATAPAGTNTTQLATTAFVRQAANTIAMVSATPPAAPSVGQLWYDSVSGYLKVWDGTDWTLSSGPLQVLVEPVYDYYVATTGNDANDGKTPATAWQTLQTAILWIFNNLDFNRRQVILHVADGNYDGFIIQGLARGLDTPGGMIVRGNLANPAAVTITGGGPAIGVGNGSRLLLEGMTINQIGASQFPNGLLVWSDALVFYNRIIFGSATYSHISCVSGAAAYIIGPCSVITSSPMHYEISDGGAIGNWNDANWPGPNVVTMVGNPHFAGVFAHASERSQIALSPGQTSFTGAATGQRYLAEQLSIINVAGGGLNFFPGDQPGAPAASNLLSANGGLYIS